MADKTFLSWPFFSDDHRTLKAKVDAFAERELARSGDEADHKAASKELVKRLAEAGILKWAVPGQSGALDTRSLCLIRETLAYHSGLADFAFAMQGLGSGPISLFGSSEQKAAYLTGVEKGQKIAAFALSEAAAGSDVASLSLLARKDGGAYILTGEKTWISNAGIADFYVVFARTGAPDSGAKGLSAFIVDASAPGCSLASDLPVISPHPLGSVRFSDCRVPESALIGGEGDGFKVAMGTLDVFRSTVGAAALGFARRALDESVTQAKNRRVFGKNLSDYQLTQAKLAEMALKIDASALLIYRAAWTKDSGAERVTREASMAKLYATDSAQEVIDEAVQLFGGRGVLSGEIVERLYRDIRPLRIYEGTSEIQKLVIASQVLKGIQ